MSLTLNGKLEDEGVTVEEMCVRVCVRRQVIDRDKSDLSTGATTTFDGKTCSILKIFRNTILDKCFSRLSV